jgi:hypothetical protein
MIKTMVEYSQCAHQQQYTWRNLQKVPAWLEAEEKGSISSQNTP